MYRLNVSKIKHMSWEISELRYLTQEDMIEDLKNKNVLIIDSKGEKNV